MNKREYTKENMKALEQTPRNALDALLDEKENGSNGGAFVAMDKPQLPRVKWETVMGIKHEGTAIELDNGTLIVACDDGKQRAVPAAGIEVCP
jgi:hypothetical protein